MLTKEQDELIVRRVAMENIRLYAARHRKEAWAQTILRFCAEGGSDGSPLREEWQNTPQPGVER